MKAVQLVNPNDVAIQDFRRFITAWAGSYRHAVCSYLAIRTAQGPKLLVGRLLLETGIVPIDKRRVQFETQHIIAGRRVVSLNLNKFNTIVETAMQGRFRIPKYTLALPGDTASVVAYPTYHPSVNIGPRLPSLLIWGGSKHDLLSVPNYKPYEFFDWELRSSQQPFDTLSELLTHLDLPGVMQLGEGTLVEVIARSPAMISATSHISDRKAVITCRVAVGAAKNKIRLGYRIPQQTSVQRSHIKAKQLKWHTEDDLQIGNVQIPVGDALLLQAFLSYEDIALQTWWVEDPKKRLNPRYAINEVVDPDLKLLERFLFAPGKDSRGFEHGVALLLHALGFAVSHHGSIPKLEDGPDLLIMSPQNNVGVVECTTGLLDQDDKLARLVQRTRAIRKKLDEAGYSYLTIQPVIVTKLPRKEVEAHLETAAKNGIAVVCKEDLERLYTAELRLLPDPEGLFRRAVESVPRSNQESLFNN